MLDGWIMAMTATPRMLSLVCMTCMLVALSQTLVSQGWWLGCHWCLGHNDWLHGNIVGPGWRLPGLILIDFRENYSVPTCPWNHQGSTDPSQPWNAAPVSFGIGKGLGRWIYIYNHAIQQFHCRTLNASMKKYSEWAGCMKLKLSDSQVTIRTAGACSCIRPGSERRST